MQFPIFLIIALTPSLIWLFYFLKKDPHPEPRKKLLKIFAWGMLAALPAIILEEGFVCLFAPERLSPDFFISCPTTIFAGLIHNQFLISVAIIFIGIALVEETLKFLVASNQISKDKDFDEPVDAMIYMITAGLGFATAENFLIFYSSLVTISAAIPPDVFGLAPLNIELGKLAVIRFLGATFLHGLLGGLMGFFFAYAVLFPREKWFVIIGGLTIATVLHGFFNLGIIELGSANGGIITSSVIFILAIAMPWCFKRIKALHAECKVENTSIVPKLF
jgi:RsiW-degrading membrane proteinase PrsW (M82 family)